MQDIDKLFNVSNQVFQHWNLTQIPFTESAPDIDSPLLDKVFTGRTKELQQVIPLLRGQDRKRILIYGFTGIGKSAFICEVLRAIQRNLPKTIVGYLPLRQNMDLGTAALIALAEQLPENEQAQWYLHQLGLPTDMALRKRTTTAGADMVFKGEVEEETPSFQSPQYPALAFERLLKRVLKDYDRVIIGIDDLDKQDPSRVNQLLDDAQGMLKGNAWFFLSGHADGLIRDFINRERGLFDLSLKLDILDSPTRLQMLKNYLASARIKPIDATTEEATLHPFTPEVAHQICEKSQGIPRWLNRLANYILIEACRLQAPLINQAVFEQGLEYAREAIRGQKSRTAEETRLLNLILNKGLLSEENITFAELESIGVKAFNELLPYLDSLVQQDLIRFSPNSRELAIAPNPILQD